VHRRDHDRNALWFGLRPWPDRGRIRAAPGWILIQEQYVKNLFSLDGKVALVTGGSRGIGEMIATGYVHNGVRVYITSRKAEACDNTAARLSEHGECISIPADLSTPAGLATVSDALHEREEKLDILVNNAGATWGATFDEFPEQGWDKIMDINVKSPFFLSQALIDLLARSGTHEDPARIINIGSIDGLHVSRLETYSYAASKAAIIHLTRMMAKYLSGRHITVNAVAPGPFESKMMAHTLATMGDQIKADVPMGRIGRPEDMAGVAIYLASRAGSYVNGVVIPVDGGISQTV
jgi:NAD(P)-dependent dehydrogenase (short-subunit alcohol dehydrogenase family)